MNGTIGWGDFTPKTKGSDGDRLSFLWLKSGSTYKVRFVAKPVIFYKYFHRDENGVLRTAICEDPGACPVKVSHPELETPGERFASLIIDRADGELKVMEFPKSVFIQVKAWWTATQQNPGGNEGVDWAISVTGTGKKGTKYAATATLATPFTNDEKVAILAVIKDENGADTEYVQNIFKPNSVEQIEKKLFGEWENKKASTQAPAAAPAQAPAPASPAPAPAAQPAAGNVDIDW